MFNSYSEIWEELLESVQLDPEGLVHLADWTAGEEKDDDTKITSVDDRSKIAFAAIDLAKRSEALYVIALRYIDEYEKMRKAADNDDRPVDDETLLAHAVLNDVVMVLEAGAHDTAESIVRTYGEISSIVPLDLPNEENDDL